MTTDRGSKGAPGNYGCDVLFYVQHLLGIGHIRRAAVLARAFQKAGLKVVFVTGGLPIGDLGFEEVQGLAPIEVVQLPPARAQDETFAVLVDENDRPVDDAWMANRRETLLAVHERCRPRVVMIELYPFGRRKMRFELEPLIAAARESGALIACSLRDIVNRPEKADKAAWMLETFRRGFDLLYVHGDPAFFQLETSFPEAAALSERLYYTGYVTEAGQRLPPPQPDDTGAEDLKAGKGEAIVSVGGGAVGRHLVEAALAARALSPLAEIPWRVLIGPNMPEVDFQKIVAAAPAGIAVERARSDFALLLTRARLSISQGGYNTLMEVLAAGLPGVVVPFAGGTETEQTLRAGRLADQGYLTVVDEANLSGASLAAGIARALETRPLATAKPFRMDGADETARHLIAQLAARDQPQELDA
ncbi:glycosyl transferase family 28 [Pelagibius litoralis]|uniref:Glycosyl transferase family 28 n=1 Tax=Pelagibius litoralis TaxID=374515 RepID=A0A967F1X8_9PROT|nr:glycosyltransferase [Pelagibius litoralis]NIA71666.1 glycosyl transferase family 28 [Pelagibius litoralis]